MKYLCNYKNELLFYKQPKSFFVFEVLPTSEFFFVQWVQLLKTYGLHVKFIKSKKIGGIFKNLYIKESKLKNNIENIFKNKLILVYTNEKLCLFNQYFKYIKENENFIKKNKKFLWLFVYYEKKFYNTNLVKKNFLQKTYDTSKFINDIDNTTMILTNTLFQTRFSLISILNMYKYQLFNL